MSLDKNQIAAMSLRRSMPEMAEADIVEGSGRLETRDVTAKLRAFLVGAENDRKRIPPDDRAQFMLDGPVARQRWLLVRRNRVAIGRRQRLLNAEAAAPS